MERYRSFQELATNEREGIDYQVRCHVRTSHIAILAPHGGRIEPGTSQLAEYIAGEDFSFYTLEGIRSGRNSRLALGLNHFDEPECREVLRACKIAVLIDGMRSEKREVRIGGAHAALCQSTGEMLNAAGFETSREDAPPDPTCLCNRIGPGMRITTANQLSDWFESHPREMDRFVSCIRSVLLQEALERDLKQATTIARV